jgi:hypothetical protein
MPAKKVEEPKLKEVTVTTSRAGKVAIRSYGNITSDYFISIGRTFDIPESWTNEQAEEFQLEEERRMSEIVDERDQEEYDGRYQQSYLKAEDD